MSKAKITNKDTGKKKPAAYQLKILILGSDKSARASIKEMLLTIAPNVLIDEVASVAKAIKALSKQDYTFFFTSLTANGRAELDAIRFARKLSQHPHVCVVSKASDQASVSLAILNGASSYVWKSGTEDEIERCFMAVLERNSAVSPVIATALVAYLHKDILIDKQDISRLTPKESQIINFSAKGYNFKEISSLMNLKISTVYTHVRHIYEKLHVTSLSQALIIARQNGLVEKTVSRK